jgi:tRNA/rRNA methyltransferase
VVLVATRNPLNLGAAARAMSNFGFARLRVVNPYEVAFREARSAVGAAELLKNAEEYGSVAEAVEDCSLVVGTTAMRNREVLHRMHALPEGVELVRKKLRSGRVALLFGSEKTGLSNESLSYCHWLLRIPTREEHPSMNLGQAVAVCLYEIARSGPRARGISEVSIQKAAANLGHPAPRGTGGSSSKLPSAGSLERITQELLEALQLSGYLKAERSAVSDAKVRRMVRRLGLDAEDGEVLLGMLKQMLWKIRGPR